MCRWTGSEKGLTLIEVLVSFVILAVFFGIASELFHLSVDSLERIRAEARMAKALPSIRAIISDFDLSEKKKGTARWGAVRFSWDTRLLQSARSRTNLPDLETPGPPGPGRFLMKLYQIEVALETDTGTRAIRRDYTFMETQYQAVE